MEYHRIFWIVLVIFISCYTDNTENDQTTISNMIDKGNNSTSPMDPKTIDELKPIPEVVDKGKKKLSIFLCTANLFMHLGYPSQGSKIDKNDLSDKLIELLLSKANLEDMDLIIFGFQELYGNNDYFHERLMKNGAILAKSPTEQGFSNTIAVFSSSRKRDFLKSGTIQFPGSQYRTGRSACFVYIPEYDISIVNTHLFGGKYDDLVWESYKKARENMLSAIISNENTIKKKPNIILGDFNCDTKYDSLKTQNYWRNKILKNHTKDNNLTFDDVKSFLASAHNYLMKEGYISLLDRNKINTTTPFDTMPDWIYFNKEIIGSYKILEQGVYKAMNNNLSDHDFPWVKIEVEV